MSARGYCTTRTLPNPLAHSGGGTSALSVTIMAPIVVTWSDGPTDTYGATRANRPVLSIYDGTSRTVDGSTATWLVIASQGSTNLWLAKEADLATLGTLVDGRGGGEYAWLYRVDGDMLYKVPQI